jgi:hypothetical protein
VATIRTRAPESVSDRQEPAAHTFSIPEPGTSNPTNKDRSTEGTRNAAHASRPRNKEPIVVAKMMASMGPMGRFLQKAGPYVLLEALLPGGTLFALLLFLYRTGRLQPVVNVGRTGVAYLQAVVVWFEQVAFVLEPCYQWSAGAHERDGLEPLGMWPAAR